MATLTQVRVPNLGEFSDVPVIDTLVGPGDQVELEDPLITLESDKATMDVPSPLAGTVQALKVKVGDTVSEGSLILTLEAGQAGASAPAEGHNAIEAGATMADSSAPSDVAFTSAPTESSLGVRAEGDIRAEVLVLGSGPGGYTAAFRCADLGKKTVLVERYSELGGVCLNVGCIPSKALLHAAKVISETKEMRANGLKFAPPEIDPDALRAWKNRVVGQLTRGLQGLAKQREVACIHGVGTFISPNQLAVETSDGRLTVAFEQAIIAAGSEATEIPSFPHHDPRVITSNGALEIEEIPKRMLVIGGGIIGLEMATVYHELGSKITVVELMDGILPGVDRDIVKPLHKRIKQQYENIFLETKVTALEAKDNGIHVSIEGPKGPQADVFDRVLVAVGRRPNGGNIGAEQAGVQVDEYGFIRTDKQMRTNVSHIFAIGDIVGHPMLAHKATHEGKVAAEAAAGMRSYFDARVIPSVAYTDPEVAWVGITEIQANDQKLKYGKGVFPWAASGRSLALGRNEGMTKLLFDEETERVIGAGIVGPNAGDLIAEAALAIEMDCDTKDISLTIHAHPTLSETLAFAAEAFEGTITDLYLPRKTRQRKATG